MNFFGYLFIIALSVALAVAISHVLHIFVVPGTNLFNKFEIVKKLNEKEKEALAFQVLNEEKKEQSKQLIDIHNQQDEYLARYKKQYSEESVSDSSTEEAKPIPKKSKGRKKQQLSVEDALQI